MKPLRIQILEYLKQRDAVDTKIDIALPFLENDDNAIKRRALRNALIYLKEESYISLTGEPNYLELMSQGNYPSKYHSGLRASITSKGETYLRPAIIDKPSVTHNYHLDNVVNPIIGDNNTQSFKAHTISNTNKSAQSETTMTPAMKWILATVSTIIAGIIVWYLTK